MAKRQKPRLGRGLSSLMSQPVAPVKPPESDNTIAHRVGGEEEPDAQRSAASEGAVGATAVGATPGRTIERKPSGRSTPTADAGAPRRDADADHRSPHRAAPVGSPPRVDTVSHPTTHDAGGHERHHEFDGNGGGSAAGDGGAAAPGALEYVLIDSIVPNPFQPRSSLDDAALAELAASIREQGVLQPIIVRPTGARDGAGEAPAAAPTFQLVAGERRWRAAQRAGLTSVPAIVRALDDRETAELALVENVQREDLNPVDRAVALRNLADRFGLSQAALAERVGLGRSTVANLMRLTELEPAVLDLLAAGELTSGHAKALLSIPSGEARVSRAKRAAAQGMSVRALERLAADRPRGSGGRGGGEKPAAIVDLERRLGESLGTGVTITTTNRARSKGRIAIEFYDLDHFDDLMRRIGLVEQD